RGVDRARRGGGARPHRSDTQTARRPGCAVGWSPGGRRGARTQALEDPVEELVVGVAEDGAEPIAGKGGVAGERRVDPVGAAQGEAIGTRAAQHDDFRGRAVDPPGESGRVATDRWPRGLLRVQAESVNDTRAGQEANQAAVAE